MKSRAAVAFEAGKPLEIVEVDVGGPAAGEVMVEIKATGVCHTDAFTLSGNDPEGAFPAILGHEGAGVVVEVGQGVKDLKVGDHVIPLYTPECRTCDFCLHPKTNLCQAIRETQGQGVMPDHTSRFSLDGKPILHYMGCSTFSNYTVLPEIALAKVREDAPFDKICYIGCGVTTGIGAVAFTMKVEAGATVAVFGLGGIGLNVIQGAKLVGARRIIGVDLNPDKIPLATQFGMTDFVNPSEVDDVVDHLIQMTGGGVDYNLTDGASGEPYTYTLHSAGCAAGKQYLLLSLPGVEHYPFPPPSSGPYSARYRQTNVPTTALAWDFIRQFSRDAPSSPPLPPSSPPLPPRVSPG